jgi:hypothetical protein
VHSPLDGLKSRGPEPDWGGFCCRWCSGSHRRLCDSADFLQPAFLLGETEGLSPWTQYNPHGVFIALENVGYVLLNVAFLFMGVAIVGMPERLWRAAGWVFVSGGALTLAALVLYSALYRARLDYRFEVAAIAITWLVLIAAPVLLSIALGRDRAVQGRRTAPVEMSSRS